MIVQRSRVGPGPRTSRRPVVRPTLGWVLLAATLSWSLTQLAYRVFGLDFGDGVGAKVADWAPLLLPLLIAPLTTVPGILLQNRLADANARLLREVQRRTEVQAELERLSRTDPLTGVANRRGFFEDVQGRGAEDTVLVLVDLDGFKTVNDSHGHAVGDEVLCRVAAVLGEEARRVGGSVARLGGDEFVVVLPAAAGTDVATIARRLGSVPVPLDGGTVLVASATVGHARLAAGEDVDVALAAADAEMYAGKRARHRSEGTRASRG